MSEAQKLLDSLSVAADTPTVLIEPVNDVLTINPETRIINVPSSEVLFGVERDRNVERKYFKCPKIVGDNIDLSGLSIRIPYQSSSGYSDVYPVSDLKVVGDHITFSWKLNGNVFLSSGTISFAICAVKTDSNGIETNEWNTLPATGNVSAGLPHEGLTENEEFEARDALQHLLNMLNTKSEEAVQNVENTTAEQIAAVEEKGAEVLASIPEDYTTTYNAAEEAVRTKGDAIVLETTGEFITVDNSSEDPVRGLKIFGRSEQITTNGYQLFDANDIPSTSNSEVSLINNGDGSFTISGTTTTESFIKSKRYTHEETLALLKAGSIALTVEKVTKPYLYVSLHDASGRIFEINSADRATATSQIEEEWLSDPNLYMTIGFFVGSNTTIVPGTIKPMLYQDGDGTWEPYSGVYASPCPEWAQEIMSVGDNGIIDVALSTKNLFDKNRHIFIDGKTIDTDTGNLKDTTTNGWMTFEEYIIVRPDTAYVMSGNLVPSSWTSTIALYDSGRNFLRVVKCVNTGSNTYKFTTSKSTAYIRFSVHNSTIDVDTILLEEGTIVTDYCEGRTTKLALSDSTILRAIPVSSGGNYTDSNGQRWSADYVDFENGNLVRMTDEKIVTEDMYLTSKTGDENFNEFIFTLVDYDSGSYVARQIPAFCNKFVRGNYTYNTYAIATVADSGWDGKARLIFYVDKSISTFTEFMEYIGDDCKVTFQVKEPIITPLTIEEIETFKALHTNYPHTTVLNTENTFMELKYNADTKTYINQNGVDSKPVDAVLLADTANGKIYQLTITNGQVFITEKI